MKRCDPIIDELHRVREDLGRAHGFEVRRIAAAIRRRENENPEGVVRESPNGRRDRKGLVAPSRRTPELVHCPQPGCDLVPTGWHEGRQVLWKHCSDYFFHAPVPSNLDFPRFRGQAEAAFHKLPERVLAVRDALLSVERHSAEMASMSRFRRTGSPTFGARRM